jgi:hypothetical protein
MAGLDSRIVPMTRRLVIGAALVLHAFVGSAQDMRFHYPAPPAASIEVLRDQPYGSLRMDVYRPAGARTALPGLIFFNLATGANRSNTFYKAWAEIAASKNVVAILPDLGFETFERDFDALLTHLAAHASSLGIDGHRLALYAGSGNVYRSLPLVQRPSMTALKAAVMFYGSAPVKTFRRDLPILLVRAGLDRPGVNREMASLAALALNENAPVTLLNYSGGYHAFEIFNDEEMTRKVVDQTIAFVIAATDPGYQASIQRGLAESTAAAHVAQNNFSEAARAYGDLVKTRPDDTRLRLAYGEALLGAGRFADACTTLAALKGKGLGPRDLGVPAARACMQSGDVDAAIAWIASIPQQYRPASLQNDPIFAPIKERPEFKALFK